MAAPPEEIEAAARQFVRKISGFSKPAAHNVAAFEEAVHEIAHVSQHLLESLEIRGRTQRVEDAPSPPSRGRAPLPAFGGTPPCFLPQ